MNNELFEALTILEKEKNISKDTLLDAIKQSLLQACKNHYGKTEANNVVVNIDPQTCDFEVYAEKTVVDHVEDELAQISLTNAKLKDSRYELGDIVRVDIKSKEFGRIATQNAKNVILQKIREEERKVLYNEYYQKERDIVTGIVQRYVGRNVSINLGKVDALLTADEMIKGEVYRPTERIKVYVLEVKDMPKGPKILVSRTHPELVKRLFESEVTEVKDGTVEIRSIAREAGSRTKIAVWSNNPDVDPVGACVGLNGARVNAVVEELHGEKIDIINWNDNPALLIENALSPAKVISVIADGDEKTAKVVVPDYQLSLAIGKEGQNARLAARLTGFKIDIKSETQARESGDLLEYEEDYYDDEYYDEDEYYEEEYSEDSQEYDEEYPEASEEYQEEQPGEKLPYEEDEGADENRDEGDLE
ncbi:MAG TPA: transcription termination/antitermination protein NusA [Candidatus Choladousia intestinavium]|uniref:Transcription termination/antitermination protein NusA n=1 Tax=Candidatus Choladousia intestinavium TaxID=2840727 RepID=A0A9D1AEQ6_9FIRM|nr:transcription termination/antitermination protein NusA [Candidatus Choladousia intestinavium]